MFLFVIRLAPFSLKNAFVLFLFFFSARSKDCSNTCGSTSTRKKTSECSRSSLIRDVKTESTSKVSKPAPILLPSSSTRSTTAPNRGRLVTTESTSKAARPAPELLPKNNTKSTATPNRVPLHFVLERVAVNRKVEKQTKSSSTIKEKEEKIEQYSDNDADVYTQIFAETVHMPADAHGRKRTLINDVFLKKLTPPVRVCVFPRRSDPKKVCPSTCLNFKVTCVLCKNASNPFIGYVKWFLTEPKKHLLQIRAKGKHEHSEIPTDDALRNATELRTVKEYCEGKTHIGSRELRKFFKDKGVPIRQSSPQVQNFVKNFHTCYRVHPTG